MLFYHHGLLCASHPFAIISLVITIVMFMWLVATTYVPFLRFYGIYNFTRFYAICFILGVRGNIARTAL